MRLLLKLETVLHRLQSNLLFFRIDAAGNFAESGSRIAGRAKRSLQLLSRLYTSKSVAISENQNACIVSRLGSRKQTCYCSRLRPQLRLEFARAMADGRHNRKHLPVSRASHLLAPLSTLHNVCLNATTSS